MFLMFRSLINLFPPSGSLVSAGSQAFNSGSGNFTVPNYNTLTVEVWGSGGPGQGISSTNATVDGTIGGASSCSTLTMTANAGGATSGLSAGAGGTASGGNTTNTSGTAGTANGSTATNCVGGGSPNGGGNTLPIPTADVGDGSKHNGQPGAAPGAGGSGARENLPGGGAGAGGGGYSKSVYVFGVTSGFPAVGAALAWSVGAGGVPGAAPSGFPGGTGANGGVKFTWA